MELLLKYQSFLLNVNFKAVMEGKMDEVLGVFGVDLDGRFSSVRTSETNLGTRMFLLQLLYSVKKSRQFQKKDFLSHREILEKRYIKE